MKPGIEHRLELSVGLAMKLGGGLVLVAVVNGDETLYSSRLACPDCGISVPQLEPRSFSFNSSYGACPECHGLGSRYDLDPAKVIVDWSKPMLDGGLGPGSASQNLIRSIQLVVASLRFRFGDALREISRQDSEPAAEWRAAARARQRQGSSGFSAISSRISNPRLPIPIANICSISCRRPNVRCATASVCVRKAWR